ncbi:hypothetical protein BRAS3843_1730017 [Bradyrhizobium sp. STM 3843]|uniref:hypothetical protein n=1 Tax=Bradyrhizobium sp. STM 3843 TaxID=551947 RepID=UPI0002407122|nr:hypothetical protein [Bradyrhizobium sp. STM 3843]CCE06448.1 hypothetical protein BRAS3843_1730017 [Bradyrhizobium sp. STM 3843]
MNYTRQIITRVSPPEDEFLRERAERQEQSIAKVMRGLIQDAMQAARQQRNQQEVA